MFQRIKNLLEISKYTVEELCEKTDWLKYPEYLSEVNNISKYNPATIVDLKGTNPFDEYETTEQSSDDTTLRNW